MIDDPSYPTASPAAAGPHRSSGRISRRELIAWLAAATGAGVAGSSVLAGGTRSTGAPIRPEPASARPAAAPSMSSVPSGPAAIGSRRWADLTPAPVADRMLVVVELAGGNDGLSTVVPHGITGYHDLRSTTRIEAADVIDLDGEVGLHPNLAGVAGLGVSLVEGIGSFTPDGSHFEMMARWWSGRSDSPTATGWVGRAADLLHDGSVPTTAISVGSGAHPILRSSDAPTLSLPSLDALWAVAGASPDDHFLSTFQASLDRLGSDDGSTSGARHRRAIRDARSFGEGLAGADDETDVYGRFGYDWGFGSALHLAATLTAHDVGVKIVHIVMDGDFDTHDGHDWRHPELMAALDRNLVAFHAELDAHGVADRVAVMTVSEFGRTATENGSSGLDHGTASTALVLGPGAGGRIGEHPSLTSFDDHGHLVPTAPFDDYVAGTVEHWLGLPADEIAPNAVERLRPLA
jgi:uncharacterized protein (DUF1501 family)